MPARTRSSPAEPATAPPPAYFVSLTVENVRCFGPAQTLDLSDGNGRPARWTVILGENGLGKSTLLQCLAYNSHMAFTTPFIDEIAMVRPAPEDSHVGDTQPDERLIKPRKDEMAFTLNLAFGPNLSAASHFTKEWLASEWIRFSDSMLMKHQDSSNSSRTNEFICYAYGANRWINRSRRKDDYTRGTCETLFHDNIGLPDPELWLLESDHLARIDSPIQRRLQSYADQVKQAVIALLPDLNDLRVATPLTVGRSPSIEALTPDGWIPLRYLGSGYQGHLAWVIDLASRLFERYPDSDDPLAEPAVVLVDELDLHMHPRWQRDIIRYLTERLPNTQFIVTAHSPLIVQAAENANLVLLRREGDHVVIDNDPVRLRNWRVDQILTSELFGLESARPPQVEGLLKERRALLSKGRMTADDRRRLTALETEIGDLPAGESVEDSQAMEIIRRAAAKLRDQGGA